MDLLNKYLEPLQFTRVDEYFQMDINFVDYLINEINHDLTK